MASAKGVQKTELCQFDYLTIYIFININNTVTGFMELILKLFNVYSLAFTTGGVTGNK